MSKKISLTGIKPTGAPHFGNYIGAVRPALEMANSDEYEGIYFIADYHSLTSVHDPKLLNEYIYEVAATWLACGLNPDKTTIYLQSQVSEVMEFNWILSCFTSKGLMNRAHAYKAFVQKNEELGRDEDQGVNMGLYTYPILMACDILIHKADVVPVGEDQLQHVEISRDIANAFNHNYKKELFKLPEGMARKGVMLPGLDGRKMSKSYNNHIPLFLDEKKLRKTVMKITTDSTPPEAPKDPNASLVFDLFKFFANESQQAELAAWYKRGIGWGEAKDELFKVMNNEIGEAREKYNHYMSNKHLIDEILHAGAAKLRPGIQEYLKEVKEVIGVR
ncbi:tryptophan--tRNA ligase [Bacteriovorax sp. BSW11_IV]|uniref:tryptophan--tRNA ligase n=1 Tax=Bacteriovorax sp. BSW11_IV TaxID=1353529 RepID=UPI00038A011D|nr:tryptophan--tRNA ligase [Bacteriovorax sp. BSW11_IV]EQC45735.1 tryptophan--tRNA ligase [Bacteriovorax sp. BSW11_IV]